MIQSAQPFGHYLPANSSESRRCQLTTKCTLQQHAHIHISPVNSTPPPKKNKGSHPQLEPRPANRDAVQPEGTRPIQPRDTATGGANTGVRPGLDLPASAATTGVRPTQTEGHRQRDTDRGTQTEGHRQRDTDRGKSSQCNQRDAASEIRSEDFGLCGRTVKRTAQWAVRR